MNKKHWMIFVILAIALIVVFAATVSAEEVVAALVRFWKEKGDATPAQEVAQGRRRPSPILEEEEIVAPYDLPRNFVGQITVRKGQPHRPDPIVLE